MIMLDKIIEDQKEFQRLLDIPVDSLAEVDKLQMAELHVYKAIEELIELRKTFPSTLNKHEKNRPVINREEIKKEFCDSLLYHINFANVWNISVKEVLDTLSIVQDNNFKKAKEKIMGRLNSEILRVPTGPTGAVGIGSGSLMPVFIFVGQNPAEGIESGYQFFSNRNDGSSKILIPVLEELGMLDYCYFTNIVKSTTPKNVKPSNELTKFWMEFLYRELEILKRGCPAKIIPMGKYAQIWMNMPGIPHPAAVSYNSVTLEEFKKKVAIATYNSSKS